MKNRFLILLFTYIAYSSITIAQDSSLSGKVVNSGNQPLPFATTLLHKVSDSTLIKATTTNENGEFYFSALSVGLYFVKVTSIGFQDYTSPPIKIKKTDTYMGIVSMEASTEALEEVRIVAKKPIIEVLADKTVFNVDKTINSVGNNGFELLRKAPGVIIDNSNSIVVEGKTGVQIYIDGRPSALSGSDLVSYLETLQASDIDSIEIITQPSSKYEAAGNAGIINIKLKKDKSLGTNGNIGIGFTQGKFPRANSSLSLNNRGKRTNIYGTYSNRFGSSFGFINLDRTQNGTRYSQRSESQYENNSHNSKVGFDYYINDKHTLGIIATGSFNNSVGDSQSRTPIIPLEEETIEEILLAESNSNNIYFNINGNLNYKFADTLGHELIVNLDYGKYNSDRSNYQPNFYVNTNETDTLRSSIVRFITPINIEIYAAQFDYEQNLIGGKISGGGRVSYISTENTFNFFDIVNGQDIFNPSQSNLFYYTENINALYLNFNRKWDKWNFQFGMRMEQTLSEGELSSSQNLDNQLVKRDYVNWFPSGGLTYKANPKNSFAFTYSRRIQRPSYQSLNPFQYNIDELSFREGNPFLQPQYTNNFRLAHTYNYRLTTALSYSSVSDFFAQVTEARGEGRSAIISRNVAEQKIYTLSVSYPTKLFEWWSIYISASAFRSEYEPTSDSFVAIDQNTFSFYGQNTFSLPSDISMEISGWYSSPSIWGGTYRTDGLGSLDVAFQKKFLANRLSARIAFSDILYTIPWKGTTKFGDLRIDGSGGGDTRQLRFSLNYNFGSNEVKKARERKTGIEDAEQNRID